MEGTWAFGASSKWSALRRSIDAWGDRVRRFPEGLQCQHRSGTHEKWPVCTPLLTDQTCWVG